MEIIAKKKEAPGSTRKNDSVSGLLFIFVKPVEVG